MNSTAEKRLTPAAQSIRASRKAQSLRRIGSASSSMQADIEEMTALELMKAPDLVRGAGEVMPADSEKFGLLDTLENPTAIGAYASEARQDLLSDASVLELGIDASESIAAGNSLERMLGHQFAASHSLAMKLAAKAVEEGLPPVEMARLTNAAARMMDVFQAGMLTLQRFRSGGQQRITVQHVNIGDGGQAIVAGGGINEQS